MTGRIALAAAALLALAGCGARYARDARAWARGKPLAALEACIGIPNTTDKLADVSTIVQWVAADSAVPLTIPLPLVGGVASGLTTALAIPASALTGSLSIAAGGGSCRAIAVVRDGRVVGLRYAGPGDGLSGANALCGTDIVRGCMRD